MWVGRWVNGVLNANAEKDISGKHVVDVDIVKGIIVWCDKIYGVSKQHILFAGLKCFGENIIDFSIYIA